MDPVQEPARNAGTELHPEPPLEEIEANLRKVDRRDWWFWGHAAVVILLLTIAIFSFTLGPFLNGHDPFYQFRLTQSVRALIGLILLFNAYSLYQLILIKRLRRELSQQKIDAVVFRKLAMFDPLTGLYNRRFAEKRLEAEVARARRKRHPLTLLLLDLDKFKEINDVYGHAAGDLVLKTFAEHLTRAIRGSDLAVRMGGDEFLVLLPECHLGQLQTVLQRLGPVRVEMGKHSEVVNFSAGWAEYSSDESPEQFLDRADRALYLNKRSSVAPLLTESRLH